MSQTDYIAFISYRHPNYHVRLENGRILSYLPGKVNDREFHGLDIYDLDHLKERAQNLLEDRK